ncbi:MAG: hypothetical protein R3182_13275, partial [Draconibacterium sp.]|nr:hypothetical protein [Draconibacterium sp.]
MKIKSLVTIPLLFVFIVSVSQEFPKIEESERIKKLEPPNGKIRMVLDTDTYNEVDDQFALCYALLSPEKIKLEAIYAAPFHNNRSSGPGDGMKKSYDEILRLLKFMGKPAENFAFKGSDSYLKNIKKPIESDATRDLIKRAMKSSPEDPLYVVPVG